jgi:hypothetical protein
MNTKLNTCPDCYEIADGCECLGPRFDDTPYRRPLSVRFLRWYRRNRQTAAGLAVYFGAVAVLTGLAWFVVVVAFEVSNLMGIK